MSSYRGVIFIKYSENINKMNEAIQILNLIVTIWSGIMIVIISRDVDKLRSSMTLKEKKE